jgi:hypothetical protein
MVAVLVVVVVVVSEVSVVGVVSVVVVDVVVGSTPELHEAVTIATPMPAHSF